MRSFARLAATHTKRFLLLSVAWQCLGMFFMVVAGRNEVLGQPRDDDDHSTPTENPDHGSNLRVIGEHA